MKTRTLLFGVSLLALAAPAVHAQQTMQPGMPGAAGEMESGRYMVFFGYDQATLNAEARQVVSRATDEFQRSGAARVIVTGHTDLAGSPDYNRRLSERRAEAVRAELVRQGVPAGVITTIGAGETAPLVYTGEGVAEAQNRRVEIEIPQPAVAAAPPAPPPAPPPVAAAPVDRAPMEPMALAPVGEFRIGGAWGHNFRERDEGTESNLGGLEIGLGYYLTPNVMLSLEQLAYYGYNATDDGFGGRSVIGLDLQGNWGGFRPYIGVNVGGVYGRAVQNGFVAGPELGVKIDVAQNSFLYGKVSYDYQFRNQWDSLSDWDDRGLVIGGIGFGYRF
ncbi:MAG TPA: OmpA family protein [Geminicoccaceae bacterium]|nr:OmpA family protein [Geminicoccaceae bacterium]